MNLGEVIRGIEAAEAQRAARAERLREQKAKSYYGTAQWRGVRYLFLRQQRWHTLLSPSMCRRKTSSRSARYFSGSVALRRCAKNAVADTMARHPR